MNTVEEGNRLQLDFSKLKKVAACSAGVIPVAVQYVDTREVLLVAYVNEEALAEAIRRKTAVFWSTSRNALWIKGETSGETFDLEEIRVNCEQNSLLYLVRPVRGGTCHTKNKKGDPRNCYYRTLNMKTGLLENRDP